MVGARRQTPQLLLQLSIIIAVLGLLLCAELVQGWHAHIHVPLLKQLPCKAEQEGQQQRTDVCAVHIRIRQQDHLQPCSTADISDPATLQQLNPTAKRAHVMVMSAASKYTSRPC